MKRPLLITGMLLLTGLACQSIIPDTDDQADEPSSTATPSGPTVLFEDDFSDPLSNWGTTEDSDATLSIVDGSFRINILTPQNIFWSTPGENIPDARIEVDAQKVGGPDAAEYGVLCRYSEDENGNHSFYYLVIAGDTYAAIIKVINNEQVEVSSRDVQFESIRGGNASNHITAECAGDQLSLTANGTELFNITDASLAGGDVGLIATTYDEGGIEVEFDNFIVTEP